MNVSHHDDVPGEEVAAATPAGKRERPLVWDDAANEDGESSDGEGSQLAGSKKQK